MNASLHRVAVVGAGAVGSFFGAALAQAGHPVTLIGRAAHVEAIARAGLRLERAGGQVEIVPIAASVELSAVQGADLVLFCVKSTDTEAVADAMAPHLGADALVLSLQNGVENAATIARRVPQPVVPAVVYVATAMPEPGVVKHYGRGDLVIGAMRAADAAQPALAARLQGLVDLFATAKVPVRISADVMAELWSKLMVNCAYNAISGLAQMPYGRMAAMPAIRELQQAVVAEVVAVAAADGVELPLAALARGDGRHRRGHAGPAFVHRPGHGARQAERDRPSQRLRRPARARARHRDPDQPGLACAGEARRVRLAMAEPGTDAIPVPEEFAQALRELGLAGAEPLVGQPLTGGVSSDIWRIDTARGPVCAKRALSKLRVAADWRAPIARNLYEARWMQVAQRAAPGCTAEVLGQHPRLGVLVMSYLEPSRYVLWKQALRDGHADAATARAVGRMLARIHAYSAARPELAAEFADRCDLLRHPSRALPAGDGGAPSRPGAADRGAGEGDAGECRRPGARRRQPEEHPGRRRRGRC